MIKCKNHRYIPDHRHGEEYCPNCGLVNEVLDTEVSEWMYDEDEATTLEVLRHTDNTMSTKGVIDRRDIQKLPPGCKGKFKKLAKRWEWC